MTRKADTDYLLHELTESELLGFALYPADRIAEHRLLLTLAPRYFVIAAMPIYIFMTESGEPIQHARHVLRTRHDLKRSELPFVWHSESSIDGALSPRSPLRSLRLLQPSKCSSGAQLA